LIVPKALKCGQPFRKDKIQLQAGSTIKIIGDPDSISTKECVAVSYPFFVRDLHVGDDILFDDVEIELKVAGKDEQYLYCNVLNDGELGSRKSVNVPGVRINLPSLSARDKENIYLPSEIILIL
jgi:pyruvate kinase